MGKCVAHPSEDIPFASNIRCHGGVEADGTAQLCGSTEPHHMGEAGTVKADTKDWYQGNGPNSQVWPWIKCGLGPIEAETGQSRADAVEGGSDGGPVVQDSGIARVTVRPTQTSMRSYSAPTTPPPLPSLAKKHSTPKSQKTHPSGLVASLLAHFQQSQQSWTWDVSPRNMPSKNMPVKDTPKKSKQTPAKKLLTPDKSAELTIKKQQTGSPSSEWETETDHDGVEKSKKRRKKRRASPPWPPTQKAEETEEKQEKCQWARKWKQELKELQEYRESHNIFLHTLPEQGSGSHMGYPESCILDAGPGFFFIRSFKEWQYELQKQSQGIRHSVSSACRRLQTLERMYDVKLSSQYNVCTKYLVEVFKYPSTGDRIPMDAADGYGSTPMIRLYGLMEPYSIARITTTQSGVVGKDGKKKSMSKCYCSVCDYVVQNHPLINNHIHMHLHLLLLCTINGFFHIEHGCNDMWGSCYQGAQYTLRTCGGTTIEEVKNQEVSDPSNAGGVRHLSSACFQDLVDALLSCAVLL